MPPILTSRYKKNKEIEWWALGINWKALLKLCCFGLW